MKNISVVGGLLIQRWSRITRQLGVLGTVLAAAGAAFAQTLAVGTVAGTVGTSTPFSNTAPVTFNNPYGVAVDGSGNAYIADTSNHVIRKISSAGVVSTLAGSPGSPGFVNDATAGAPAARFSAPRGITINSAGTTLYVADTANHAIRVIALSGVGGTVTGVSTLAGTGSSGSADSGASSTFNGPRGIALNSAGDTLYVADTFNHTVRSIVIAGPTVATVAGLAGTPGTANGDSATARFDAPWGIAVNAAGTALFVADFNNHAIRRIALTPSVAVTTYAGIIGTPGFSNSSTGTSALFRNPAGLATDGSDNLYVGEFGNNALRLIAAATGNAVTTVAGGTSGSADGSGTLAQFNGPTGVAVRTISATLFVFVTDTNNQLIRKAAPPAAASVGSPGNQAVPVGGTATFTATVAGGWPTPTLQWYRQPGGVGSFQVVTASATYSGVNTQTLTVSSVTVAMNNDKFKLVATNASGAPESSVATLTVNQPPVYNPTSVTFAATVGQPANFSAAVTSGTTPVSYSVTSGSLAPFFLNTSTGAITGTPSSTADAVSGVVITANNGFAPNATLNVNITVSLSSPPVLSGPANQQLAAGATTATFSVTATGVPTDFTYQWQRNPGGTSSFADITNGQSGNLVFSGATSASLSISGITPVENGDTYRVVVKNNNTATPNTTISNPATLSVPPNITSGNNTIFVVGQFLNFPFSAVGTPTPTFNVSGTLPSGITSSGSGLSGTAAVGTAGTYILSVTATNSGGTSATQSFTLNVSEPTAPIITSPASASFVVGTPVLFTFTATGAPTPTISLSGSLPAGLSFTSPVLSGTPTSTDGSPFTLTVTASNGVGTPATQQFVITLTGVSPTITLNPVSVTVNVGGTATFTAAATGSPTPTLRWQRQPSGTSTWSDLSDDVFTYEGTTTGTLLVKNVSAAMSLDQYRMVATNNTGIGNTPVSAATTPATLTVNLGTVITTIAGAAQVPGFADATGINARFNTPSGIAADADGNLYIADTANHVIRKMTSGGVVTTIAGQAGVSGNADGTTSAARFNSPQGVAVDRAGNVYVADTFNHTIRVISQGLSTVTTLAGLAGSSGAADGVGNLARFFGPTALAVDFSGTIYVADTSNHAIRRVLSNGTVSTYAGALGSFGFFDSSSPLVARFNGPSGIALDNFGNVYVADSLNNAIRKITVFSGVTTLAGFGGLAGNADGTGTAARFNRPTGIAVDSSGNVFVADTFNSTIRKVTSLGDVTTLAGLASTTGFADGAGSTARFNLPLGVAVDANNNLYIADTRNHTIRRSGSTIAPSILTQPLSKIVSLGQTVTFSVTATGAPTPGYQWQRQAVTDSNGFVNLTNDGTFSGVDTPTLTITNVTSIMNGDQFRVVVNNGVVPVATSNAVTLTVGVTPVFTSAATATFQAGQNGSFKVTVNSPTTVTFSSAGLPSWASLNSVTGDITGIPPDTTGTPFTVVITANNGITATQTLTINVTPAVFPPSINTQPVSAVVDQGQNVTFSVSVGGTAPFTYQWRRNGVAIPGATGQSLALNNVQSANAGSYTVVVTNAVSSVTSNSATLAVNTPPSIAVQPHGEVALAGSSVTFSVTATGANNIQYQWRKNGVAIPGATGPTLTVNNVAAADAGNYDVFVSNSLGTFGSSLAQLTIVTTATAPVITAQPAARTALIGTPVLFSVGATSAPAPVYQWRKNGTNIVGANGPLLAISSVQAGDAANYDVVITNSVGSVTSNPAGLRVIARSYAGIYFGSFSSGLGQFALYVRDDNTGVFLGYLPGSTAPVMTLALSVSDNGQFAFSQAQIATAAPGQGEPARAEALSPVIVSGAIANDGSITGAVQGGANATLTGSRAPDTGATQPFVGFYQAGASTSAAVVYTIAGADGRAFVVAQSGSASDGGAGTISSSGTVLVSTSRSVVTETVAANGTITGTSTGAVFTTISGGNDAGLARQRLLNISSRARVATADSVAIAGFVISGEESKPVLIRAVGPTLGSFGVAGALASPRLELFRGSTSLGVNTGIAANRTAIDAAGVQAGAFALGASGGDAAILTTLAPGNYTAVVSSTTNTAGVALIEVYDLSAPAPGQKLLNISTRASAGTADATLIAGFVVPAGSAKRVLIRGIGPGLTPFGVTGVLAQPILTLLNGNTVVATNTNWRTSADQADITTASAQVGGFSLATNDSALLVTLPPGNYTAQVLGTGGTTGVALIEVYEVP